MRWICFFLLFANMGYGLWNAVYVHARPYADTSQMAVSVTAASGGASLVLIDEITSADGQQFPADFNAHSGDNSATKVDVDDVPLQPTPDATVTLEPTLSSLTLNKDALDAPKLSEAETPSKILSGANPAQCWAAGPVFQPTDADHLARRALALGDQVKTKTLNVKTGEEYWVYLKPLASHKAALIRLRELQTQKIDSFIVTRGQYKHAISLGLFSQIELANQHQARMKAKGLDPKIEVRDRTRREFWVQFHLDQPLGSSTKQRLRGELEALEWQPIQCEAELAADL